MLLGRENAEGKINLKIAGEHVEQIHSIKILGVHIDDKLNLDFTLVRSVKGLVNKLEY